jgi:hypothetical protein
VIECDAETVRRFQDYLTQLEARERRDQTTPEIGDTVETPDARRRRVTRVLHSEHLGLPSDAGDVPVAPAEFARVVQKA